MYIVWRDDDSEPEIWAYYGMESQTFANLNEFLRFCLQQ